MRIDLEALRSLLRNVFLNSTDNSREAIEQGLTEIENITYGETTEWITYDGYDYCLIDKED